MGDNVYLGAIGSVLGTRETSQIVKSMVSGIEKVLTALAVAIFV